MNKRFLLSFIRGVAFATFMWILTIPSYAPVSSAEDNYYKITMNGELVGKLSSYGDVLECMQEARRRVAEGNTELVLADADMELDSSYEFFGLTDSMARVTDNMTQALINGQKSTLKRSYTVKINEYSVNLSSMDAVYELIFASKNKYDENDEYEVKLGTDSSRQINVLTASVRHREDLQQEEQLEEGLLMAGFEGALQETVVSTEANPDNLDFTAFQTGVIDIALGDTVEIVESYLPESELMNTEDAISEVTKDKDTNQVYVVQSGDTLSGIASKYGLTIDDLIAMNDSLENANSTIRVSDRLVVTVPQPLLNVAYTTQEYIQGQTYVLPTEYIDDPDLYQDETSVVREGVTGVRDVILLTTYEDGAVLSNEVIKEEIKVQPVATILRRGTKVRPTYVKPISGGVLTSRFGYRNFRGSEFHSGTDWGIPTGTSVFASCSGVVTRAGWFGGYGYCVDIQHPDGRMTRYGHNSKVLVKVGQYVNQLDVIALSGSTGDSTGPHLHFEMRIGGQAVDALQYIQ